MQVNILSVQEVKFPGNDGKEVHYLEIWFQDPEYNSKRRTIGIVPTSIKTSKVALINKIQKPGPAEFVFETRFWNGEPKSVLTDIRIDSK
ncbi:MAG: hypothetical protein N2645_18415 [Clostridia bacterium]|nr:hypothetical protein [Clostridia bacterium]